MQKCRVLLVDDHVPIRIALRRMLTSYDNVHVVGEACDGKQAIELVPLYQPHVVLMDFDARRMNGIEAARIMKESWQEIVIIGISMAPDTFITDAFGEAPALQQWYRKTTLVIFIPQFSTLFRKHYGKHRLLSTSRTLVLIL